MAGTERSSRSAPSEWIPIRLMRSHALSRPSRQAWQVPHATTGQTATRWPGCERRRAVGPDVLDDRRELVALDARIQLVVRDRSHVAVEVVEVGAAEPDGLGAQDDVAGLRRAGLGDVDDLHRRARARDCGAHAYPLPCMGRHRHLSVCDVTTRATGWKQVVRPNRLASGQDGER